MKKILSKYASVLVDFALGSGSGIRKNQVVLLQYDESAQPLALAVFQRILAKGAHPLLRQHDEAFDPVFFQQANQKQLTFFPAKYNQAMVETIDHRLYLMADKDPLALRTVNPRKLILANQAKQKLKEWLFAKEDQGKLTWTLALFATIGAAQQAGLTLEQYWEQIIKACYLDLADPIAKWKATYAAINRILAVLNKMPINKIRVVAKNTDITYTLGAKRRFMGSSGRNIPSFEIFTSPDARCTEGHIYFDFPLYRYGNLIEGIYLEFQQGRVVKARARKNKSLLQQIIKQKGANRVGEFSLTDKRFSKIDQFMANTLYDENYGGQFGNTHLALGSSYHDCYTGKARTMHLADWQKLGFNESVEHTDIIAKQNRTVTVELHNKQICTIYKDGRFWI